MTACVCLISRQKVCVTENTQVIAVSSSEHVHSLLPALDKLSTRLPALLLHPAHSSKGKKQTWIPREKSRKDSQLPLPFPLVLHLPGGMIRELGFLLFASFDGIKLFVGNNPWLILVNYLFSVLPPAHGACFIFKWGLLMNFNGIKHRMQTEQRILVRGPAIIRSWKETACYLCLFSVKGSSVLWLQMYTL